MRGKRKAFFLHPQPSRDGFKGLRSLSVYPLVLHGREGLSSMFLGVKGVSSHLPNVAQISFWQKHNLIPFSSGSGLLVCFVIARRMAITCFLAHKSASPHINIKCVPKRTTERILSMKRVAFAFDAKGDVQFPSHTHAHVHTNCYTMLLIKLFTNPAHTDSNVLCLFFRVLRSSAGCFPMFKQETLIEINTLTRTLGTRKGWLSRSRIPSYWPGVKAIKWQNALAHIVPAAAGSNGCLAKIYRLIKFILPTFHRAALSFAHSLSLSLWVKSGKDEK